jgi:hypothetical protein
MMAQHQIQRRNIHAFTLSTRCPPVPVLHHRAVAIDGVAWREVDLLVVQCKRTVARQAQLRVLRTKVKLVFVFVTSRAILDLAEMLREHRVRLRVVSVRSADNASDAASRDRKLTFAEYARCWKAVQAELAGWRQEVPTCWRDVDGGRDFDPEDMETSFPDTLAEFVEEEFGPVPEELTPNISGCTELISDALFENPSV